MAMTISNSESPSVPSEKSVTLPRPTLQDMEILFAGWRSGLTRYLGSAASNYYWPLTPPEGVDVSTEEKYQRWASEELPQEIERRGRALHELHVEAYHAGEIYRGALRALFL